MARDEYDPYRLSVLGAALFATMMIGIGSALLVNQLTATNRTGGTLVFALMLVAAGVGYWIWALRRRVIDLRGRTAGPGSPPE